MAKLKWKYDREEECHKASGEDQDYAVVPYVGWYGLEFDHGYINFINRVKDCKSIAQAVEDATCKKASA